MRIIFLSLISLLLIFDLAVLNIDKVFGNDFAVDYLEDNKSKIENIVNIIKKTKVKIKNTKNKLLNAKNLTRYEKKQERDKLKELIKKLENSQNIFVYLTTNIDLMENKEKELEEDRNLVKELQDLLIPVIDGLRRVSARPRKIEKLRREIETLLERQKILTEGINNLKTYYKSLSKFSKGTLDESKKLLTNRLEEVQESLTENESKLNNEMGQSRSTIDIGKEIIKGFFSRRGKNILIAFLVFFLTFWFLLWIKKRKFVKRFFEGENMVWLEKPVKIVYSYLSFIIAFVLSFMSLYFLNDWLLVTLFTLILLALFWSLKRFIPKFVEEGKLILNIGSVRENEKLIWKGVPWRVKHLGLYSKLENNRLDGGYVRVKAKDLMTLYSRPFAVDEDIFPTQKGDWVILNDSLYGKIVIQTPEQVIIDKFDGGMKYYNVERFLELSPENLSRGFRIETIWSLDYQVVDSVLQKVPRVILDNLKENLNKDYNAKLIDPKSIEVEFKNATNNSLDLWIKVDCSGELADQKRNIERKITQILIDISNKSGYKVAYNRLAVSMQDKICI